MVMPHLLLSDITSIGKIRLIKKKVLGKSVVQFIKSSNVFPYIIQMVLLVDII